MKLINGWKAFYKQWDKIELQLRISKITLIHIKIDITSRKYKVMLLNFGITNI